MMERYNAKKRTVAGMRLVQLNCIESVTRIKVVLMIVTGIENRIRFFQYLGIFIPIFFQ